MHIVWEVSIGIKASQCLEPLHKMFPSLEIFISVKQIQVFFSDWVMQSINKIKDVIMPPPTDDELKLLLDT